VGFFKSIGHIFLFETKIPFFWMGLLLGLLIQKLSQNFWAKYYFEVLAIGCNMFLQPFSRYVDGLFGL